jgi:hypothetical protein
MIFTQSEWYPNFVTEGPFHPPALRDTFVLAGIAGQEQGSMKYFKGYTTRGAAQLLGVSVSTIKRMVYRGELKPLVKGSPGRPYVFASQKGWICVEPVSGQRLP